MSRYSNRLQPALQNLLQRVVRFFHPRSSCMMTHISADVRRIILNASCMTISWGKNRRTRYILPRHWLYEWFSQFHRGGTYSVLSRSLSVVLFWTNSRNVLQVANVAVDIVFICWKGTNVSTAVHGMFHTSNDSNTCLLAIFHDSPGKLVPEYHRYG